MGRREVGAQKWAAGEWRGKEGVGVMDEGMESPTRARCHGRGCGGLGGMEEGAVRGVSAAQMRAQQGGHQRHG